jgi:hypothetical protein
LAILKIGMEAVKEFMTEFVLAATPRASVDCAGGRHDLLATTLVMRAVGGQVYNTAMAHAALGDDVVGEFLHLHRCLRDGGEAPYHHKSYFGGDCAAAKGSTLNRSAASMTAL